MVVATALPSCSAVTERTANRLPLLTFCTLYEKGLSAFEAATKYVCRFDRMKSSDTVLYAAAALMDMSTPPGTTPECAHVHGWWTFSNTCAEDVRALQPLNTNGMIDAGTGHTAPYL